MNPPVSFQPFDGGCQFVDKFGRVYTATGFTIEAGDRIGVESSYDGLWFTLDRDDQRNRYPLRDEGGWHCTDLTAIRVWNNPRLPEEAV
jgi:hypothetical protein